MTLSTKASRNTARIEYLDALKAFSILLVVFCHMPMLGRDTVLGNIAMSLAWAAVPCFMMTSGALMLQAKTFSWRKYFIKIGRTYAGFAGWRLIYLIVHILLKKLHFGIIPIIQYLFLFTELEGVNTNVMWYMIVYFIILFLYPVTYYLFSGQTGRKILLMMGILAGASGMLIPSGNWLFQTIEASSGAERIILSGINRILPYTNTEGMLFYFILGGFLFEYRDKIANKLKKKSFLIIVGMLAGTAGLMTIKYLDAGVWGWGDTYLSNGYAHMTTVLLSVCMFLFFSYFPMKHVYHFLAKHIGKYTMGIYYMHFIVLSACQVLLYPMLKNCYSFSMNCIKTIVITAVCAAVTILLRKIPGLKVLT